MSKHDTIESDRRPEGRDAFLRPPRLSSVGPLDAESPEGRRSGFVLGVDLLGKV